MESFLNHLVFGIYHYLALATLAIGSMIRFDREPYSWSSGSSQLLRRKQLMWGSVLFHVGVLFIFVGNLAGLLTRSDAPTSDIQTLMRTSYAVLCTKTTKT